MLIGELMAPFFYAKSTAQSTGTGKEHTGQPQQPPPSAKRDQGHQNSRHEFHQRLGQKAASGQKRTHSVARSEQRPQAQPQRGDILPPCVLASGLDFFRH